MVKANHMIKDFFTFNLDACGSEETSRNILKNKIRDSLFFYYFMMYLVLFTMLPLAGLRQKLF